MRLTYAMARGFGIRQLITEPDRADDRLFVTWQKMAQAMLDASTSKARSKPRAGHRPTR